MHLSESNTHFIQIPLASKPSMDLDYSDGVEIESRIEGLLSEASDLRSTTSIAHARYSEWPVRYHLCPERSNLLRHLNFSDLNVLELGAGMGAVSRFLAESARTLTVVEGTEQRFRALSERLRDLSNWKGTVSNIMDASFDESFDAVVVVGALEYSELYVTPSSPEESPFDTFLKKAKSFLKPGGVLILAIENQIGLKYFNGAPEDHTSHPFDGISGYPQEKSAKTFSRKKLFQLFETAGFRSRHDYFPFPDYKTPTCVLTPVFALTEPGVATQLATHRPVEGNALRWNSVLATRTIADAGLLPELSNSFLVVASEDPDSEILRRVMPPADQLAWHYSMNRKAPTCTKFIREQGTVRSQKVELSQHFESTFVKWTPMASEPIKRGLAVREEILRAGHFKSADAWYSVLKGYLSWAIAHFKTSNDSLVGHSLDALFTNATEGIDPQSYELFDLEWTHPKDVSISWFILRNVLALYNDAEFLPFKPESNSLMSLYEKLCKDFLVLPALEKDIEQEAHFQVEVTPESSIEAFTLALHDRVREPLLQKIKRESEVQISLKQKRLSNLSLRFPDFLSALDRPSTRFFLVLDEKLRSSRLFRTLFDKAKTAARFAYRLLQTSYTVRKIEKTKEGKDVVLLEKGFGPLPKAGWLLITFDCEAETVPASLTLHLSINGRTFNLNIPRLKRAFFSRIVRLHEPVQALSVICDSKDDLIIKAARSRNLLKAEVVFRTVLPQLRRGFAWKLELERAKSYWKQGKSRGLIAYLHTLVQRADIGIVESYNDWTQKFDTLTETDREQISRQIQSFDILPKISILMPVYNTEPKWLERAVHSVTQQLYPHWELCIADDASTNANTIALLRALEKRDPRIKVIFRKTNGHISQASNTALENATGDFIGILDHDDELSETALYHVVRELNKTRDLEFLYSDEDKIDTQNRRFLPHFKSDWNPELFYAYNLITHFAVIRTTLVKSVGGFRSGYEGSQDYDLFLRCIEKLRPDQIRHIPYILYHWRVLDTSTSGHIAAKPYAKSAALRALNEHLQRRNIKASVSEGYNDCFRIRYALPKELPKVSVVICTRDRADLLRTVIEGLEHATDYSNFEVLIVNNRSSEKATLRYLSELARDPKVRIIEYNNEFNFAAMNNLAAQVANGELLAFLNNDLKITNSDWLKEMVSFAIQSHIGAVGAKLLYPSGRLQHAGVILGIGGVAGHSHKGLGRHQTDFYARTRVSQCLSAVTAACLVVRKSLFEEVHGFDETHLTVAFNDVDLCLKLREKGYQNVWTPYAELIHFESESRGSDQRPETFPRFQKEEAFMKEKWGSVLKQDPYYNPNLTLERENFDFAYPPRVGKPWKKFNEVSPHA